MQRRSTQFPSSFGKRQGWSGRHLGHFPAPPKTMGVPGLGKVPKKRSTWEVCTCKSSCLSNRSTDGGMTMDVFLPPCFPPPGPQAWGD